MSGIAAHLILNKRSLAYWINHGEEAEVFFFFYLAGHGHVTLTLTFIGCK